MSEPSSATSTTQPGTDHRGGLALLDDRRADETLADAEIGAPVHGRVDVPPACGRSAPCGSAVRLAVRRCRPRPAARPVGGRVRRQPPGDRLDADVGDRQAVDPAVVASRTARRPRRRWPATVIAVADPDRDLVALAEVPGVERRSGSGLRRRGTPAAAQHRAAPRRAARRAARRARRRRSPSSDADHRCGRGRCAPARPACRTPTARWR